MNIARLLLLTGCCAVMAGLGACAFETPTKIHTTAQAEVYEDSFSVQDETARFDAKAIANIGRHYAAHGTGPVHVSVLYDPGSKTYTAKKAGDDSQRITKELNYNGVEQVEAEIMPVPETGDISQTSIIYSTVQAMAPSDCPEVMGRDFSSISAVEDYKLGCTVETYIARQVARPKDLLGNDVMSNGNGQRAVNGLNAYVDGEPNEELQGELASEDN